MYQVEARHSIGMLVSLWYESCALRVSFAVLHSSKSISVIVLKLYMNVGPDSSVIYRLARGHPGGRRGEVISQHCPTSPF